MASQKELLQLAALFAEATSGITQGRSQLAENLREDVIPTALEGAILEEIRKEERKRKKSGLLEAVGGAVGGGVGSLVAPGIGTAIGATLGSGLGSEAGGGDFTRAAARTGLSQAAGLVSSRLSAPSALQTRRAELEQQISDIENKENPSFGDALVRAQAQRNLAELPGPSLGTRARQAFAGGVGDLVNNAFSSFAQQNPEPIDVGSTFGLRPQQQANVQAEVRRIQEQEIEFERERRAQVQREIERQEDFANEVKLLDLQTKSAARLQKIRQAGQAEEGRLNRAHESALSQLERDSQDLNAAANRALQRESIESRERISREGIASDERIAASRNAATAANTSALNASRQAQIDLANRQFDESIRQERAAQLERVQDAILTGAVPSTEAAAARLVASGYFTQEEADQALNVKHVTPPESGTGAGEQPTVATPTVNQTRIDRTRGALVESARRQHISNARRKIEEIQPPQRVRSPADTLLRGAARTGHLRSGPQVPRPRPVINPEDIERSLSTFRR